MFSLQRASVKDSCLPGKDFLHKMPFPGRLEGRVATSLSTGQRMETMTVKASASHRLVVDAETLCPPADQPGASEGLTMRKLFHASNLNLS